ncbi:hypothetical protein DUNSADRAFT_13315 [Dunaliella salina]|uniref:Uncharacterized protein n=1 Tax=Dunaliella salina TaxID=3046 RepID=A0ABQ7G9N0_DUNSA|nr:hypothetical protein DUNSADRAFT_13315 [Dunaliella salina]|eukprot:KAF5831314.1 hypothetical protein DUNSADRAFT_13315 [Dunaliella salina]
MLDPDKEGFEGALRSRMAQLDPHEKDIWKALLVARAKSEIVSCAYVFMRGFHPPYNSFTQDLRHIKPDSKLRRLLEAEGTFKEAEELAAYAELGMWIQANRIPIRTIVPQCLPQKQQLHEWAMPEADADALGAALSSLALELISLVVENVGKTPDPPKALFDTSNAAQTSAAGTSTPETQSSSSNSLRSRLAKKAEHQQLKRTEDEWLQKTKHIQVSQRMRWMDLLVVLSNLFGFFKPDTSIPRTCWRLVVSTHVAASVCRMLGLVFRWADNRESLVLKLLACSSAEELAGVLTTQVSSMVREILVPVLFVA